MPAICLFICLSARWDAHAFSMLFFIALRAGSTTVSYRVSGRYAEEEAPPFPMHFFLHFSPLVFICSDVRGLSESRFLFFWILLVPNLWN